MAGYGRPLKGKTRRVPITVHTAIGILDIIDQYVEERNQEEKSYSRSDFYNEAARLYLEHLGRLPEEEKDQEEKKAYQNRTDCRRPAGRGLLAHEPYEDVLQK
jgi:hypothetical protein